MKWRNTLLARHVLLTDKPKNCFRIFEGDRSLWNLDVNAKIILKLILKIQYRSVD
jgi:hypothetical protein